MTNKLEKQFFTTYGIIPEVREFEGKLVNIYPVITPDKLLALICMNNRNWVKQEDLIVPKNIETIEESTLKKFIKRNKEYLYSGYDGFCLDQVRTLFEEG